MNRRSFITKALAGLAAIPLLGKLEFLLPAPTIAPQPTVLTALLPTLHEACDVVSREMVGFIPAVQSELFVAAAKVYPRALTDVEIVQAYAKAREVSDSSSDTTV